MYFYKKLLIILISVSMLTPILKGILIITLLLVFNFITTKNEHIATLHFQNVRHHMLEIIIISLILKSIEYSIDENSDFFICFNLIQSRVVLILNFAFICSLFKNFLILKQRRNPYFKIFIKKYVIIRSLFQGNN